MVIFNSYVSLPEGIVFINKQINELRWLKHVAKRTAS